MHQYRKPQIEYVQKSASEELKERVDRFFPNNWKAKLILIEDTEQSLNENELFQIIAKKNKDCILIQNGKEEKVNGLTEQKVDVSTLYIIMIKTSI